MELPMRELRGQSDRQVNVAPGVWIWRHSTAYQGSAKSLSNRRRRFERQFRENV